MTKKMASVAVAVVCFGFLPSLGSAITIGQSDDFEDGSVMAWNGHAPSITNISSGGPAGSDDNFLKVVSSGGNGGGSRLVAFNTTQWSGDYRSAGVTQITADVNNLSSTDDLHLRVAFGNGTNFGSSWFASTTPVILPAGGGWQSAAFDLSDVSQVSGGASLSDVLMNVAQFRILSSVGLPSTNAAGIARGDQISGQVGLDNVSAIPEPASGLLAGGALWAALTMLRRCKCVLRHP